MEVRFSNPPILHTGELGSNKVNSTHQEGSGRSKEGQSAATAWGEKQRNSGRHVLCSFFSKTEGNRAAGGGGSPSFSQSCVCQQVDRRVRGGKLGTRERGRQAGVGQPLVNQLHVRWREGACTCVRVREGYSHTCRVRCFTDVLLRC